MRLATVVVLTFSPWLALVFLLLTVRAAVVPGLGFTPKQLGIGEVVSTLVVAVVSLVTV